MHILDQIREGILKVKDQQREQVMKKLDLVPVIFANGEDDDFVGLRAAINNQKVQYKDKVYEPDENIFFDHDEFASVTVFNVGCASTGRLILFHHMLAYDAKCYCGNRLLTFNVCTFSLIPRRSNVIVGISC